MLETRKRPIDITRVPLAMKEDGTAWMWERHHTGIIGTTGSGKNSPLLAMLRQDEPLIRAGLVSPYALISPKDAQLSRLRQSSLVDEFASEDLFDQLTVVSNVYKTMRTRIQYQEWEASLKPEEYERARQEGRLRELTPKTLLIDEFSSFMPIISKLTLPGISEIVVNKKGEKEEIPMTAGSAINNILSKGRAPKVFIVMASQEFIETFIGRKTNFQYWIFLRIKPSKTHWIDDAFGEGEKEMGARPDLIPALPNNGSAGIAYVGEEGQDTIRVRFPYTSKEDMDSLMERTRNDVRYTGPTEFDQTL